MSDSYVAVVDEQATKENAAVLASKVLNELMEQQIIQNRLDRMAVLGGEGGYPPGNRIPELYEFRDRESEWWSFCPNGFEAITEPWVNVHGITWFEELICPKCSARFDSVGSIPKGMFKAARRFMKGEPISDVICPRCGKATNASGWKAKPHLGFCHLTFLFWNWPPFDYKSWKIDIPALIENILGHPIVITHGHI